MHSVGNSLRKRMYSLLLRSAACRERWSGEYGQEANGVRKISCRSCPRFDAATSSCSIPFGTPVRKCSSAAQEAHLHSLHGLHLLEIGFGKHSIPWRLVRSAGGTWTGIDPAQPASRKARLGRGGWGHAAEIPFPDNTFDIVCGIQTIEHWEQPLPRSGGRAGYAACLNELWRVLKSGGRVYLDAPMHLHGHEMFVVGDIERIRGLFDSSHWCDVTIEVWREDHAPLERYPTPPGDAATWQQSVTNYPRELLDDIRARRSVCLIAIEAAKRA